MQLSKVWLRPEDICIETQHCILLTNWAGNQVSTSSVSANIYGTSLAESKWTNWPSPPRCRPHKTEHTTHKRTHTFSGNPLELSSSCLMDLAYCCLWHKYFLCSYKPVSGQPNLQQIDIIQLQLFLFTWFLHCVPFFTADLWHYFEGSLRVFRGDYLWAVRTGTFPNTWADRRLPHIVHNVDTGKDCDWYPLLLTLNKCCRF